jgi:hypothetical protein
MKLNVVSGRWKHINGKMVADCNEIQILDDTGKAIGILEGVQSIGIGKGHAQLDLSEIFINGESNQRSPHAL